MSGQVYSSLPEILRFLGLICLEAVNMSQTVAEHLLKDLEPELSAKMKAVKRVGISERSLQPMEEKSEARNRSIPDPIDDRKFQE